MRRVLQFLWRCLPWAHLGEIDELREAAERLQVEKLIMQDRLDNATADRNRLWEITKEAMAGERSALRMQVNFAMQRQYGTAPYPEEAKIPDPMVPHVQEPGPAHARMTASELVRKKEREFRSELINRMNAKLGS